MISDIERRYCLIIRRPPRTTQSGSSAAADVYKRQVASITDWEMLRGEEGYVQSGEPAHAEEALSWVLEAMHLYAFDLGLAREATKKERK